MGFYQGLWLGILAAVLSACSIEKQDSDLDSGEPVRVQVPFAVDGNYRLEIVELFTLRNIGKLEGLAAKFFIDPTTSGGRIRGRSPQFRYIRDQEGVVVAKDDLSLQLMTVYAHFEKLQQLDAKAGVGHVLLYPRNVAVNVQFTDRNGRMENNALYSGQYDSLLIVPYTGQHLPLMVNAGVLGHEHFHALFQKLVILPLKEKYPEARKSTGHNEKAFLEAMRLSESTGAVFREDKLEVSKKDKRTRYHAALFRAINEGFADVWGWIYSGDNVFVGRSLPHEKANRDIEVVPQRLFPQSELMSAVESEEPDQVLLYKSYQHGTQLARTLRNFASIYAAQKNLKANHVRENMARFLMLTLPKLRQDFASLKSDEFYSLSRAVFIFSREVSDMTSRECYFLAKLMPLEDREFTQMEKDCRSREAKETEVLP